MRASRATDSGTLLFSPRVFVELPLASGAIRPKRSWGVGQFEYSSVTTVSGGQGLCSCAYYRRCFVRFVLRWNFCGRIFEI